MCASSSLTLSPRGLGPALGRVRVPTVQVVVTGESYLGTRICLEAGVQTPPTSRCHCGDTR